MWWSTIRSPEPTVPLRAIVADGVCVSGCRGEIVHVAVAVAVRRSWSVTVTERVWLPAAETESAAV